MAINPFVLGLAVTEQQNGAPFWDSSGDEEDGYEGPDYMTDPHDVAFLNGSKVPGITRIKCTGKKKIDVPKATSRDGGPTTDRGHEAARLEITVTLWTPAQWKIWQEITKKLWRPPNAPLSDSDIKAISIYHPSCSSEPLSVFSILIETYESAEWSPQKGAVVRIKAVQFIPHKAADVTRAVRGAGVPVTKEFAEAKGSAPPKPSTTDAVPVLPTPPSRGSH